MTKKEVVFAVSLILASFGTANAAFTAFGSSGETNTRQIFENLYGGYGTVTGSNWGDMSYTIGDSVTATRIDDYVAAGAGDNLYLLSPALPGSDKTDQIWHDGIAAITARARFAGYKQQFGFDNGTGYQQILDVGNQKGFMDISADPETFNAGTTWEWIRKGSGLEWSSLRSSNTDGLDHLITYYIEGLDDDAVTWVLFWDDQYGGGDRDFNDFVIEIKATIAPVPAPGAVLLGSMGIGIVGWLKKRRAL
ncbi:MAG: DUF4114 domain-containing protein [Planctomycetota bacterium]|jgi:hypothetical protein